MSIAEQARAAQERQFTEDNADEELRALTKKVYDQIDALDDPCKRLLIGDTLSMVHSALTHMAERDHNPYASSLLGLLALGGYANETIREEAGDTATGDRRVSEVLDTFKSLVSAAAQQSLSPQQRQDMNELTRRVRERIEKTGEDPDKALAEEVKNFPDFQPVSADGQPQTTERSATEPDQGYGMYL